MNRAAVSQAQVCRTVKALESMGKTVAGVILRPDGTAEVRLTAGDNDALPSQDQNEWDYLIRQ